MPPDGNGKKPKKSRANGSRLHFTSMLQSEVPRFRKGKHNQIVKEILGDVESVSGAQAIRIPRHELESSVQKVRSALSRASKQRNLDIATAADGSFLYVWRRVPREQ